MTDHIEAIQRRLERMIAEAESRISGNGSILSYGMKMRRDTAEEILGFVKRLARTAATVAPARDPGFDRVQAKPSTRRPSLEAAKHAGRDEIHSVRARRITPRSDVFIRQTMHQTKKKVGQRNGAKQIV